MSAGHPQGLSLVLWLSAKILMLQCLKLAFCGELVVGAEREDFLSLYFSVCLSVSVCVIIIDVLFVYSLLSYLTVNVLVISNTVATADM